MTVYLTLEKEWQNKFIKHLSEKANVSAACRKAGISRQYAYQIRDEDGVFKKAWDEALIIATEALEYEARRRAEEGVLDPIYYKDSQVGAVRKYSDTLLIFLLKAHRPETYRDNSHVEHSGEITIAKKAYVNVNPGEWSEDNPDSTV